jgi:hypothetical protein
MSNVYKFCGCRACRVGRRPNRTYIRAEMRKLRHRTKEALKKGKEPPTKISIPYTD